MSDNPSNINKSSFEENDDTFFTKEKNLELIHLYTEYKPKVNKGEIKSMKKMWEKISFDLSNKFKTTIIPSKCENKFRVLERSYKKTKDNNNKTGRARIDFIYEAQFDEIFGRNVNINPKILLGTEAVPSTSRGTVEEQIVEVINVADNDEIPLLSVPTTTSTPTTSSNKPKEPRIKRKRPTTTYKKRNDILIELKNDFKEYYTKKLQIEQEKLEEKRKRNQLLEKYLNEHSSSK